MKVIAIVAATENNVIGKDNEMPWHLPDDFKFFKAKTLHHTVLMGSNTWKSIGKALKHRTNLILSRSLPDNQENGIVFKTAQEAFDYCTNEHVAELHIIGGGKVYEHLLERCDVVLMTRIHTIIHGGEAFFPHLDASHWHRTEATEHAADERHKYSFTFETWERIML